MIKPEFSQLGLYQNHALQVILQHYDKHEDVTIVMPPGSGKTLLAMFVLQELGRRPEVKKTLYISYFKSTAEQFEEIRASFGLTSQNSLALTVTKATMMLAEERIAADEFQAIVFDDVDDAAETIGLFYKYFKGFKVGFSRGTDHITITPEPPRKQNLYTYSLSQAYKDGYLVKSQELDLAQQIEELKSEIGKITPGTDWNRTISQSILQQVEQLKKKNTEYFRAQELLLSGKIDHTEIIEMSYRKEQLAEFQRLLEDADYFDSQIPTNRGTESVWQNFFERNQWIFGFGLNYVFNAPLEGGGLERTVAGFSVTGHGKRSDALLTTTGLIRSLCFGEIKTHRKEILKPVGTPYRSESWSISDELAGGIAQVQRTVQKSLMNIVEALDVKDAAGYRTNESIYLFKPKSFLIIGSLNEFKNAQGQVQEDKFSSFELFRRSIADLEIITFDELFQRANAIVHKKWNG